MKSGTLALIMAVVFSIAGMCYSEVIWENDCSSLNGWSWSSESGSGVYVINGAQIQMNSWNNSAKWTNMWRGTNIIIDDNATYTLTARMVSWSGGDDNVAMSFSDTSGTPWVEMHAENVVPATGSYTDYSISFSTMDAENSEFVYGKLGFGLAPGWWNNLGVDHVSIERVYGPGPYDPLPGNDMNPDDNIDAVGLASTVGVDVTLEWNTMMDPEAPETVYGDVTKHYLYILKDDPNFVGVTPIEITATAARESYLAQALEYGATYYWQVRESINGSGPDDTATYPGPIWAFETIEEAPVIIVEPADILVAPGDSALFEMSVSSGSPITVNWYLSQDKELDTLSDILLQTTSEASLTIETVGLEDAGKYVFATIDNDSDTTMLSRAALLEVERLAGHWRMDNDFTDASGNDFTASYGLNPVFEAGYDNQAILLDSDPNMVVVEQSEESFNFYHLGLTLSCWVKNDTNGWQGLISKQDRYLSDNWEGYVFVLNGSGNANFNLRGAGGISSVSQVNDNQWHLVTATYDSQTGQIAIYVDGELENQTTLTANPLMADNPVVIGAEQPTGDTLSLYQGLIDDARIYTYALSPAQVLDIYNDLTDPDKVLCLYPNVADITGPQGSPDCQVNLLDFAMFANNWLENGNYPQ
ncbi:MAG: hypothetical protein JEZ07_17530 [Phycisphaerae bacterium]|nr:hypothetical protein [Phycisphaerae bacterium]